MNPSSLPPLSNNKIRQMNQWAASHFAKDAEGRCAVVVEYLAQLDDEVVEKLISQGWPAVFDTAARDWPEAFADFATESEPEE